MASGPHIDTWSTKHFIASVVFVAAGLGPFLFAAFWRTSVHDLLIFTGVLSLFLGMAASPQFLFQPWSQARTQVPRIFLVGFFGQIAFNFLAALSRLLHVGYP